MERIRLGQTRNIFTWNDSSGINTTNNVGIIKIENGNNVANQLRTAASTTTPSLMDLGKQLLEYAREGKATKVHELMCRGAPFTSDWLGNSPLHMAAMNNHYETCNVLLNAGISKDSRTKVDRTPLHLAVYYGHESIVKLLLEKKCSVNAKDSLIMTPLHWAVERRYPKLVTLLLENGADPKAFSKFKKTPISMAAETNQPDVLQELLTHNPISVYQQEQQDATDSLMVEMSKDNYEPIRQSDLDDSTSTENSPISISFPTNVNGNNQQQSNSNTLQLLKDESTVMDDSDEFLQSVCQSGRQLVLSDAGRQLLTNCPNLLKVQSSSANVHPTNQVPLKSENGDIKKKPSTVFITNSSATKTQSTPNVIKGISVDLARLCGEGKIIKTLSSDSIQNGTIRLPKDLSKVRMSPIVKTISNDRLAQLSSTATVKTSNNVPIVIKSLSETSNLSLARIMNEPPQLVTLNSPRFGKPTVVTNLAPKARPAPTQQLPPQPQKMITISESTLQDILRQLAELKKQTGDLQSQCDNYRCRLETLEKERGIDYANMAT